MGLKLFISYSHRDSKLCERFRNHLKALSRLHDFEQWYDGEIPAGGDIDKEILKNLKSSDIIFLLISPDFIASYYCYEKELEMAIKRHREGKCVVVPVICKSFVSGNYPFSNLKYVPTDGRPINSFRPQDDGFINACTGINNLLQEFEDNRKPSANKTASSKTNKTNKGTRSKKSSSSASKTTANVKYEVVKNGKLANVLLSQSIFNSIVEYSIALPQFIQKIEETITQQLQTLSTLINARTPDSTIVAYERNNLEVFLIQEFSYVQQLFIGIDNTCAHFRYLNKNAYCSFVNIGYPSIQLSTEPIQATGGMIECSSNLGLPIIKNFNRTLHNITHPDESIARDYLTYKFSDIKKLYDVDISMCISVVGNNNNKNRDTLVPLVVLEMGQLIERFLMQYIARCIQFDPKYNLKKVLNLEVK